MNVKFKMPKFGRKLTGGSMLKELLLTILATSISIILTFGTAMWLEQRQKEKNRRQTAMMVISDIYDFKCELQWYDSVCFTKWEKDIEELQTLSSDTIMRLTDEERQKYWDALTTPLAMTRDKTAENIFTSDISTWREVGNYRFIKMVGHTYSAITDIEKNFNRKMEDKGIYAKNFETNYDIENMSDGEKLIAFIEQKEVKRYMLDFCEGFCPYIHNCIEDMQYFIDKCMNIMGISKEELDEFMTNSQ